MLDPISVETPPSNSNHVRYRTEGAMFVRLTLFLCLFTAVLTPSLSLGQVPPGGFEIPPNFSEFGLIISLNTGWPDDTMSIKLGGVPFVNTGEFGGCKVTTAGYALDPNGPDVKVHEAVLLSAFLAGKKVSVGIRGCFKGKPRIVAVTMGNP